MRSESRALGLGGGLIMALALGACTENNFYTQKHTDVFQQARRNTVDVLLVVDNSCSMVEEQNKLASNFQAFIQFFQGVDVDYQIGVITTDNEAEEFSGRLVGGDGKQHRQGVNGHGLNQVIDVHGGEFQGSGRAVNGPIGPGGLRHPGPGAGPRARRW